jgi:hypothetical protein
MVAVRRSRARPPGRKIRAHGRPIDLSNLPEKRCILRGYVEAKVADCRTEPAEAHSARKLVMETAKFNVIGSHSGRRLWKAYRNFLTWTR